jgi:hypothetical protein
LQGIPVTNAVEIESIKQLRLQKVKPYQKKLKSNRRERGEGEYRVLACWMSASRDLRESLKDNFPMLRLTIVIFSETNSHQTNKKIKLPSVITILSRKKFHDKSDNLEKESIR